MTADDDLSNEELDAIQAVTIRKPTAWERRAFVAGRKFQQATIDLGDAHFDMFGEHKGSPHDR